MGTYRHALDLCDQMYLLEFSDFLVVEPADRNDCQSLLLERSNGKLQLIWKTSYSGQKPLKMSMIFGLVGVINLLAGLYALVVTQREQVGFHNGSQVFRISGMKFFSCNPGMKLLSSQEMKDEAHFVSLLLEVEKTPGLFFSYQADLTLSLQRGNNLVTVRDSQPLWKQADPRFLWNHYMLEELIEGKMEPYILPVIQGSFQVIEVPIKDACMSLTLISRRCNRRLGTRMWRRGADLEGHAANFVETEQIMHANNYIASYVQKRVVERHFHDLVQQYGSVVVIDLVNQQGSEEVLSLAYANAMENLADQRIKYVQFDFNKVCGHLHFERLSLLCDWIADDVKEQRYFMVKPKENVQEQKGIVRVNCIDCLDRTNITQSMVGRKVLETILKDIDIFEKQELINQHDSLDQKFKILWATHGDDISMQYSGTHALKGDFVRHGKRTVLGLLKDGFNALARYYLNNFYDGTRQDATDLIAGHYVVSRLKPSPFQLNGFEAFAYLPLASALVVAGLTFTTRSMCVAGQDVCYFVSSVLWAGFTAGVTAAVKANGRLFCSRPRLCKLL